MTLTTTFRELKDWGACSESYRRLARCLGGIKKYGRDNPIPLTIGFDHDFSNDDIIWVLFRVDRRAAQRFASDCAAHVLHIYEKEYPKDDRPRVAIQAARDFASGKITEEELVGAAGAAGAAGADGGAARAARAAGWAARATGAARAARATGAARAAEEAAGAAGAAWATGAAWAAARAARAAGGAAWAAEKKWQRERLKKYCEEKARVIKL